MHARMYGGCMRACVRECMHVYACGVAGHCMCACGEHVCVYMYILYIMALALASILALVL